MNFSLFDKTIGKILTMNFISMKGYIKKKFVFILLQILFEYEFL